MPIPLFPRKASLDTILQHYPIASGIAISSHYVDLMNLSSISKAVRQSMLSTLSHPQYKFQVDGLRQYALKNTCGKLIRGGPKATKCVVCNVQICQSHRATFDPQGPIPQSQGCCVVRELPCRIPHDSLCQALCNICMPGRRPGCTCEGGTEGRRTLCLSCANRPEELQNYSATLMDMYNELDETMFSEVRCTSCPKVGNVGDTIWRWLCMVCGDECRTPGHDMVFRGLDLWPKNLSARA